MNALTGAGVLAENKLFSTLDTRTRQWHLKDWGRVLLSDTVGFIRDLPHHLVASFKATLEEARQARLLLHVVDASNPHAEEQIMAVNKVLKELGCGDKPTLLVLNKADRVPDLSFLQVLREPPPAGGRRQRRDAAGAGRPAPRRSSRCSAPTSSTPTVETDVGQRQGAGVPRRPRRDLSPGVPRQPRRHRLRAAEAPVPPHHRAERRGALRGGRTASTRGRENQAFSRDPEGSSSRARAPLRVAAKRSRLIRYSRVVEPHHPDQDHPHDHSPPPRLPPRRRRRRRAARARRSPPRSPRCPSSTRTSTSGI